MENKSQPGGIGKRAKGREKSDRVVEVQQA